MSLVWRCVVFPIIVLSTFASSSVAAPSDELVLERVLDRLGGRAALEALDTIQYKTSGKTTFSKQNLDWDDPPLLNSKYRGTTTSALNANAHRIEYQREIVFPFWLLGNTDYSETINGQFGVIEGTDNNLGSPLLSSPRAMSSARVESTRKRLQLLNPLILLKQVIDGEREYSVQRSSGRVAEIFRREVLVLDDSVYPIHLNLSPAYDIRRLTTKEHGNVLGDVNLRVDYFSWARARESRLRFPRIVKMRYDDEIALREWRGKAVVNGTLDPELFSLRGDVPQLLEPAEAVRGMRTHHIHTEFCSSGLPIVDRVLPFIFPVVIAPGVYHLRGGTHHALVIEQEDRVILIEAALYEERAIAIFNWIQENIGKPITHIVNTHHHPDHSGGLRTIIAKGVDVVLHENSLSFLDEVLSRPRTIRPDLFSEAPVVPTVHTVAQSGRITLDDPERPVTLVHHDQTEHSNDLLLVWLPEQDVIYASDVYSPGLGLFLPEVERLVNEIDEEGLAVTRVIGSHGTESSLDELRAFIAPAATR